MIRHACKPRPASSILLLPVAMVLSTFGALLMAPVSVASLLATSFGLAGWAAITLPPITAATNPEHCMAIAAAAQPLTENNLALTRHPRRQVGLDNGDRSWQGRIIPLWLPDEGCQAGALLLLAARPAAVPAFEDELTFE